MRQRIFIIFLLFALFGLVSGLFLVYFTKTTFLQTPIPLNPPSSPFDHYIATEGIIEPRNGDFYINAAVSDIVVQVYVEAGRIVKKDDPLYQLDDTLAKKALSVSEREYDIALAEYQKLLALPRPEDVPPLEAHVEQKKSSYQEAIDRYALYEKITNEKAVSLDERNTKKFATFVSKYELAESEANLKKLLAGAWEKDLAISLAQLAQKKAAVERQRTEVERHLIRAPIDGSVLSVNINPGEFIGQSNPVIPPIKLGQIDILDVRVNVPEEEIWRVLTDAKAVAFVRGNSEISVPLEYIRLEPNCTPKRILSGNILEIVDTRVLPVIYRFTRNDLPIYPGQVMDVYMEAKPYGPYR